jgi:class 3 adenylate cyclase
LWDSAGVSADRAAAPSGVVTFLFTDIEGSTRRWEADAAAMRVALVNHDEVLRIAIEEHGGFLFSHTGDGVVAAFASPMSAVEAAVAAQRALELPVRMGIATGEAGLRDGDYFGTVLNRAARVMAAGHGGPPARRTRPPAPAQCGMT